MSSQLIEELINHLPLNHQIALRWFHQHRGTIQPWTSSVGNDILLVSKAKGIYKPKETKYALSVRQNINSPYPDREPIYDKNGNWRYLYHQENDDPAMRDNEYTNRGLMECYFDQVPVGVMQQTKLKPNPEYRVLGLALVTGWHDGYFILENAENSTRENSTLSDSLPPRQKGDLFVDTRQKALIETVVRQGQPNFRRELLDAYEEQCAITYCSVTQVLEAAHIIPYSGSDSNTLKNGLLLRSDIHGLFDQGLIGIDANMKVVIAQNLKNTMYHELEGKSIKMPNNVNDRPSPFLLEKHRIWAGL